MKRLLPALLLCLLPFKLPAEPLTVTVAEPYLELRTGPGRGYPVTQVVPRGQDVIIIKRRTDWFKVMSPRGRSGWVHRDQMVATLVPGAGLLELDDPGREGFGEQRGEAGVLAGDFGGANVITAYGSYAFNPHLHAELRLSHVLGNASNGKMATLGLTHVFRPDWRVQPFFSLGTGAIRTEPKETLAQGPDRTDQVAYVGIGIKAYLARRFFLRAEYNDHVVFTERDDNEEVSEWKIGFAFFF